MLGQLISGGQQHLLTIKFQGQKILRTQNVGGHILLGLNIFGKKSFGVNNYLRQQFLGGQTFIGPHSGTECVHNGEARTPLGRCDILYLILCIC